LLLARTASIRGSSQSLVFIEGVEPTQDPNKKLRRMYFPRGFTFSVIGSISEFSKGCKTTTRDRLAKPSRDDIMALVFNLTGC
jgi:hypothetical protein